jgi:hypothetical protein
MQLPHQDQITNSKLAKHIHDKQTGQKNELFYRKWKHLKNENNTCKIENVYK